MRILVIAQYYLLPGFPGGSRFNELGRLWSEAGHDVTVIAGTVDHPSGAKPERYRGKWLVKEADGKVKVWRCYVPTTYGNGYLGRAWGFLGFTLSAATAALLERRADVVIATSPPLVTPVPGWIAARLRRDPAKLIFEVRDLWPESAVTTGVLREGSLLTRALYGVERWACSAADCINVLTPAFKADIVKRGLASEAKIAVVPNGADVSTFKPGLRENSVRHEQGWGDKFVVMYSGAHGRANAVKQLLDAAELLRDRQDILIATVGDGPDRSRLEEDRVRRGLDNVRVCGPQPKSRMPDFVNACDVGAAVLQNNPTFRTVYPNKVFDYMACAKPTLLAIDGVARKLVCEDARAGVFAEPENPQAIADAIRGLADSPETCKEMGRRGREWVLENATREALAEEYLKVMREGPKGKHLQRGWRLLAKTVLDRAAGAAGLLMVSPALVAAAAAVRIAMGRPAFYMQQRPGRDGRLLRLVKLRTLRDARDSSGRLLSDDERRTRVGEILRTRSIDELPQLWNVAKGELSLVGPRPLLVRYLDRCSPGQMRRQQVLPGITGWAQVNEGNAVSWEERLALDAWYVDHWSLWLDLKILAKTIQQVIRQGTSHNGHATRPGVVGTNDEPRRVA